MIKVGGIQNTQVLWQAVFLAASPLASGGSAAKILFRERLQYRQLRRLGQCLPLWVGVENFCFINGFSHQGRVRFFVIVLAYKNCKFRRS